MQTLKPSEIAGDRDCSGDTRRQSPEDSLRVVGRYTRDDLRATWEFAHHDFEGFLSLLAWLETLSDVELEVQIEAARYLARRSVAQTSGASASAQPEAAKHENPEGSQGGGR
jgi:hypothetical protein